MASSRDLYRLHSLSASSATLASSPSSPPSIRADYSAPNGNYSSGSPYEGASTSRRLSGWNPSRLGPTSNLWCTHDLLLARCRDEVRNNPWASSAVDNFESQHIGNGIKPKWNISDPALKEKIEKEFHRWASTTSCDQAGLCDFYGLQALAAREIFEAGEVLCRRHIRPPSWKMKVPLQLQLIESEQLPVFINMLSTPSGNTVSVGIERNKDQVRVAYHMYREHPGESMLFPMDGMTYMRVPAENILHVYKPWRAGLLRGQPHLSSSLVLLHELSKYTDATVVAKQIQTMFAGFIHKTDVDISVLPPDSVSGSSFPSGYSDPGTEISTLEAGTLQNLAPGEDITFPTLPQNSDIQTFMSVMLHQFAVSIGATYEQITGDLRGVNLSSIRAGILDFRRKCEQFIFNVLCVQFCNPIIRWWMDEAVLAGRLTLPGYADEPEKYLDVTWNTSGWPWLDPLKDVEAKQMEVRSGFTSREAVVAERGDDVDQIDAAQVRDNARADSLGLVYDIDPRKVLIGKEANPSIDEEGEPEAESDTATPSSPSTSSSPAPKSGKKRKTPTNKAK